MENARRAAPVVERTTCGYEVRDVGDVHPGADTVPLPPERERVVVVLRRLGIDREGGQLAEVDAPVEARLGDRVRLELDARTPLDEQRLEHVLDPLRRSKRAFDAGATSTRSDDCQVAGPQVAEPLRVEHDRDTGDEIRLPGDELATTPDLDHDTVQELGSSQSPRSLRSPAPALREPVEK